MCERRYRVGERGYNLRPDALAAYRVRSQQMRFWLEWDRGTMNVRDLAVKYTSYAHAHRFAGMGKRALDAASAHLCRTGYRARRGACSVWLRPD